MGNRSDFYNSNKARVNHLGSFIILFLLSVLSPKGFLDSFDYSFAPMVLVVLAVMMIFKIHTAVGIKSFIKRNKLELGLVIVYQIVCLVTLFVNKHVFADLGQFIQWGLTFILVQSALPMALILFSLPQSQQKNNSTLYSVKQYSVFFLALFVGCLAIWQKVDPDSAIAIQRYFLSGELSGSVSSVFAINTDLGAIAAIVMATLIFWIVSHFSSTRRLYSYYLVLLLLLYIGVGILSGARIFVLISFSALIAYAVMVLNRNNTYLLACFGGILFLFALAALLAPESMAVKLGDMLPAIALLNLGFPTQLSDYLPVFDISAFGERAIIWSQAIALVLDNPFGISNGGFRLYRQSVGGDLENNTHNILIQSLVDSGFLGFVILAILLIRLTYRCRNNKYLLCLAVAVIIGLQVDNFVDHSLPWIIVTAFCFGVLNSAPSKLSTSSNISVAIQKKGTLGIINIVLILVVLMLVLAKKSATSNLPLPEYFDKLYVLYSAKHWTGGKPLMVTPNVDKKIRSHGNSKSLYIIPVVPPVCDYLYGGATLLHMDDEFVAKDSRINLKNNIQMTSIAGVPEDCELSYSDPSNFESWISNDIYLHKRSILEQKMLLMEFDYTYHRSPVFDSSNHNVEFYVRSVSADEHFPFLMVNIFDVHNNSMISREYTVGSNWQEISIPSGIGKQYIQFELRYNLSHGAISPRSSQKIYVRM